MANISANTRRKCSAILFEIWIWCLLFCVVPVSFAENNTLFMYPEGDIYVPFGNDLEIYCTARGNLTSKDLIFTRSGKELHSIQYNTTTRKLVIEKPEQQMMSTYYCKWKNNNLIGIKVVYVASPPAEVTDFGCLSKNFEVLNCSWTTPDKIYTNYSLKLWIELGWNWVPVQPVCSVQSVEVSLTRYCIWNTTSQPRYRQQVDKFYFSLEAHNAIGTRTQNFTIDHYSVVKPDPPEKLVNVSEGPHNVMLQWKLPPNIIDFLKGGIEHKIEYQIAKIDDTSYFRQVDTSSFPVFNRTTYNFNLTDLPYAHMQYGVRVYIKPKRAKNNTFWSDFSNVVFYTASERPRRPPDTVAGAFDQNKFQGLRKVRIYWKQLEEYEEAGANFTYEVLVSYGSRTQKLNPDKNKSFSYLYLDDATLGAIDVTIYSYNEKGLSLNSSHLYIPPEMETRSLRLTSFTKLAYENGTYELSWVGFNNIDNYTLFWCQHNTTNICSGRVNFTVLDPTKNKHVINLPRYYRYQFAISANNGTRTSGMVWAKCDISKDGIAMYGFPIRFIDHDAPGKTYVKLKWSMDCTLKEGIITGYNITYCPVIGTSSICDYTEGNISPTIINNPKQMEINITGLRPYRTYQFTMALNTIYGLKTIENTTVRITTPDDAPTSPRNFSISQLNSTSMLLSWDPPYHINGHISKIKYVVRNFGQIIKEFKYEDGKLTDKQRTQVILDNLTGYTNYSLTVEACNIGISSCSKPTESLNVRTCVGAPSQLNNAFKNNVLSWEPPLIPGGNVDLYQIKIVRDGKAEICNTTELSYYVTSCEGNVKNETYQVRAVNFDYDEHHGALTVNDSVLLPIRNESDTGMLAGEWSGERIIVCRSRDNLFLLIVIMGVFSVIGIVCGALKGYKKIRKMADIQPDFPKGIFVPEKDPTKYPFSTLYPSDKDEKPKSDEMLLLPNSKAAVPPVNTKQAENDNCGSSDHTDSTALSDASQVPVDRQNSTSDDDSHSSLHLEIEPIKPENTSTFQETEALKTDSSHENSPYFSDTAFKKNKATGYVQPVVNPASGYVQSAPAPFNPLPKPTQPAGSSYVMAGLSPPIFTTGVGPSSGMSLPPSSSGYVRPEDAQAGTMMFPKLGPSPTKQFGPESLPIMPTLPPPTKLGEDSGHIQLQSLDAFPSHKPSVRSTVPLKPASSGYVSPGDVVINKHLNNIMSAPHTEESVILDPAMSPDAYCRFSWSTDPANDNLNSLLANSPTITSKNAVNH